MPPSQKFNAKHPQIYIKFLFCFSFILIVHELSCLSQQSAILQQIHVQIDQQFKNAIFTSVNNTNNQKLWQQLIEASSIKFPQMAQNLFQSKILKKQGLFYNILLGSNFDYLNITKTKQFNLFKQNFINFVPHKFHQFKFDPSLQKSQKIQIFSFLDLQEAYQYLQNQVRAFIPYFISHLPDLQKFQALLGINLQWRLHDLQMSQAEYLYTEHKYKISDIQKQLPICVISTGYNVFSKGKHIRFFQSIQRQNYTNYKVVMVDDNSPDHSFSYYVQYFYNSRLLKHKLKNRIKLIQTSQKMGALANMYIWVKKYCDPESIVINVDSDDALIGSQTFKIVNAVYQDPQTWYMYSNYLKQQNELYSPNRTITRPFYFPVSKYRETSDWISSHLRTYRQKVMAKVPVQHFLQYKYNKSSGKIYPNFHDSSADRYQTYSNMEISGQNRTKYITDMLYYYEMGEVSKTGCYRELQIWQQYKSRAKTPLQPINSFNQQPKYVKNAVAPKTQQGLRGQYFWYARCLDKYQQK